jgi:hypothetical protein
VKTHQGWAVWGLILCGGKIFGTHPGSTWAYPASCTMSAGVFCGWNRQAQALSTQPNLVLKLQKE